jgi:hypothetical protein
MGVWYTPKPRRGISWPEFMRAVEFMVRGAMVGGVVVKVLDGLVRWFRMLVALCFALVNMV